VTAQQLLQGLTSALDAWEAAQPAPPALAHESAAQALTHLLGLARRSVPDWVSDPFDPSGPGFVPTIKLGTQLASRFINGRHTAAGGCCCCLAPAAAAAAAGAAATPLLSFSRAGSCLQLLDRDGRTPLRVGSLISGILSPLRHMSGQLPMLAPGEVRQIAIDGGLLLEMQHMALAVAQARSSGATGGWQRSASSGGGCADTAFFLGDVDAGALPAVMRTPAQYILKSLDFQYTCASAKNVASTLRLMGVVGSKAECPVFTPHQLRLLLEAVTMFPPEAASRRKTSYSAVSSVCMLLVAHGRAAERPWLPAFLQEVAVPILTPWVLEAARQLPMTEDYIRCVFQAPALALAASVLLSPQSSLLQAAGRGQVELLGQVMAAAELALRELPAEERWEVWPEALGGLKVSPPLACAVPPAVLPRQPQGGTAASAGRIPCSPPAAPSTQGFITATPACVSDLWRSGALPSLVVTLSKGADCSNSSLDAAGDLLRALSQPPVTGRAPWYAASGETQQFALLLLARLGRHASAMAAHMAKALEEEAVVLEAVAAMQAAVEQLTQPPLRQLVEVAAPAWLSDADAFSSSRQGAEPPASASAALSSPLLRQAVELLTAFSQQLDPLALGLALPGCYNPACTSVAGASEAGMKLKRCTGCKTARWAGSCLRCAFTWQLRVKTTPCNRCINNARTCLLAGTAAPPAPTPTGSTTRRGASGRQLPGRPASSSCSLGHWRGTQMAQLFGAG